MLPKGLFDLPFLAAATPTGPPPVTLLTDLVSYWKMYDPANGTRVDELGVGNFTDVNSNVARNTTGLLGGFEATFSTAGEFANAALSDPYAAGAGKSFTFNGWLAGGGTYNSLLILKLEATFTLNSYWTYQSSVSGNATSWNAVEIGTLATKTLNLGNVGACMLTLGYDFPNQVLFAQINGGTRQIIACAGVRSNTSPLHIGNFAALAQGWNSIQYSLQDWGFWSRALTTDEVTSLYNGGAGKAFSTF